MNTRRYQLVRSGLSLTLALAVAISVPVLLPVSLSSPSPAQAAAKAPACSLSNVALHIAPGQPSMHTVTFLLQVRNTGSHRCVLHGLASLDVLDSSGHVVLSATNSMLQPSTSISSAGSLQLEPGETATAQLVETPPLSQTPCPSYPAVAVQLPGSENETILHHSVFACPSSALDVTYFVPGYDGTSPSGELMGTTPRCASRPRSARSISPEVTINAWSGGVIAGSTTVVAGSKAPASYRIVVPPGRYKVTSDHTRSRRVTVVLGRATDLGRYGGCSTFTTKTTVPVRTPHTTTTTRPPAAVPTDRLTQIAFLSPSIGYGLFIRQTPTTCEALVGATTNGGAVFASLTTVTAWGCADNAVVSRIAFDDHGDGFVYGPGLFVTHDSGATWAQLPQDGVVLSVEALGFSVWAVETTCPILSTLQSPCPLRLLESADGGRSWGTVQVPAAASANGMTTGQSYLVRTGPATAYLTSNPSTTGQGPSATAPLWFTDDGGRTWSARQVECGIGSSMDSISAAPNGTLVAVCAGPPSAGAQPKSTVRSTDGGRTWTTMTLCPGSSTLTFACTTAPPLGVGYLGDIDAVSADTVYLVGGRSSLLVTHDGGVSWHTLEPTIGDGSNGSWNVAFFNSAEGVVLANDPNNGNALSIWSTGNAGASWHSVVPTETAAKASRLSSFVASSASFTSTKNGWVLGIAPCGKNMCTKLLRTRDGGNTWKSVRPPPARVDSSEPRGISEVHFANSQDGFAFGGDALWATHDGGRRWTHLGTVAGIKPTFVGEVASTPSRVFALVAGKNSAWRVVSAKVHSNRFRIAQALSGTTGVPLTGALATTGTTVYVIDGKALLRLSGSKASSAPLPLGQDCGGPIAASSVTDVLLVCGQGVSDGSFGTREVFRSTNGGRSWTRLADPGEGAGYDTMAIADGGDGHAAISTVSAGEGGVLVTTDSGISWVQTIDFAGQGGAPFTDLSYQSPSHAVVVYGPAQARSLNGQPFVGVGVLYKTVNGGQTWVKVSW